VSKDSDCSLVSNKYFSEILPSNGLGPEPAEVGRGGLKVLHLWRHSQKIHTPPSKKFIFECRLEDFPRPLHLWRALYHFRRPSYAQAKPCAICFFVKRIPETRQTPKC